jgi:hypothetical protein
MPPRPPGVAQAIWPNSFPAEVRPIVSAIVGGAPFARSLNPIPTGRTGVTFPLVNDVTNGPSWGGELSDVPVLDLESGEYDVAVSRLSGSILIGQESLDDAEWPVSAQVEGVIQDTFSNRLDRDFIGGAGPFPVPTGVLAVAAETTGRDLLAAATMAKGEIGTAGGEATSIAMSPTLIAGLEDIRDEVGRQLYPDASTVFAGLETVSAVAATTAIVYDATRLHIVINRDFSAEMTPFVSEAWNRYAQSLRVVGRFALAAPMPLKSVRKLKVEPAGTRSGKSA